MTKRCFILGSGPSINNQDLSLLKNDNCIVSNWFILHPQYSMIKPQYYCIWAQHFFGTAMDSTTWNPVVNFNEFLYPHINNESESIKVFPSFFRDSIESQKLFSDHTIIYLDIELSPKINEINFFETDITKKLYHGGTVVINFCIPLAISLGYKEIYLVGCDCNYTKQKHFYDEGVGKQTINNDKLSQKQVDLNVLLSFSKNGDVMQSYSVVKQYCDNIGVKIYNATDGGYLNVFDRVKYESLF